MHLLLFLLLCIITWVSCLNDFPSFSNGDCYLCPPGYRFAGVNSKCPPLTADGQPQFLNCVLCPDGYYTSSWSLSSTCQRKTVCDSSYNLKKVFDGGKTNDDLCDCIDGHEWESESQQYCSKINFGNNLTFSCPICPSFKETNCSGCHNSCEIFTSPTLASFYTKEQDFESSTVSLAVCIVLCVVFFILGGCITFSWSRLKQNDFHSSSRSNQDNLEEAFRICEALIFENNSVHDFMRQGLKLESQQIIRLNNTYGNSDNNRLMMHALNQWKKNEGSVTVRMLLNALRAVHRNDVIQQIEEDLEITEEESLM